MFRFFEYAKLVFFLDMHKFRAKLLLWEYGFYAAASLLFTEKYTKEISLRQS